MSLLKGSMLTFAGLVLAQYSAASSPKNVYDPVDHPIFQLSPDAEESFSLEQVLSLSNSGGANTAEVLRVATQLVAGNEESYHDAFYVMAESIHALAESVDVTSDPVGARQNYFHAASYYRAASTFLVGNQDDHRLITLWDQQIADFDRAIALLQPSPGEPFNVKAGNSTIGPYRVPGYFFKASSAKHEKRPTVIVTTGYDSSQQDAYHAQCVEILLRGINCVVFEGPGQPAPRRYQNFGFIPDWWTATSPVIDHIVDRSDVDAGKIALMGVSFGGSLAPIAASRDSRLSAVIVLDGLTSLAQSFESQLGPLYQLFKDGKVEEFNEQIVAIADNQSLPLNDRYSLQQSLYAFNTKSPYDWFGRLEKIVMTPEVVAGVGSRPVYVAKGQDDALTGNQANVAYHEFVTERHNGQKLTYFHEFLTRLGAGEHVSVGADTQVFTSVISWLSDVWKGYKFV